jgi:methionyl-tRNA synthetase
MTKKYYLTTPLYYVNARPHIGHSYTTVAADALARLKRMLGYEVLFLTGTDEHGQKIERASKEAGKTPLEFADALSDEFKKLWEVLGISYDDFIRTTEKRHTDAVKHVWVQMEKSGQITRQKYEGWYCTPCEAFWPARELGHDESASRNCPQCNRGLEEITEDNFFFTISKHQEWLIQYIESHPGFILPESRRNETLSFLKNNVLNDLCISRPKARLNWGIEVPISSEHVTYVWFDALINYVSALGYPDLGGRMKTFWPADVHLIGKDILRPHTVYWPIMLHALGLEPPKMVFAHGWWMVDQAKMSKSLGNVVNPVDVVQEYGIDAYRYFLLREVPFGGDGTYSDAAITSRYNVDLANDLGNLTHRTLSMMEKYFAGTIEPDGAASAAHDLRTGAEQLCVKLEGACDRMQFHEGLTEIWNVISLANRYIDDSAPWGLKKQGKDAELKVVMSSLCEVLRIVAQAVYPFMPGSAAKIWHQLGLEDKDLVSETFSTVKWNYYKQPTLVRKGDPVFPRRETEESKAKAANVKK